MPQNPDFYKARNGLVRVSSDPDNTQSCPIFAPRLYWGIYMNQASPYMSETRVCKLFKNGASQAVRLPAEFRFEGVDEVYVTRDDATGDLTISSLPGAKVWDEFFSFVDSIEIPEEFMQSRPCNSLPVERNLFGDADK